MKQVQIEYEKCKKKMSHRPPDEIDFGLGFRAATRYFLDELEIDKPYEVYRNQMKEELQ